MATPASGQARQAAIDTLFGRSHRDSRDTETEAAKDMAPHTTRLRELVLELLRANPEGLTDDEGAQLLRYTRGIHDADRLTFGRRRGELAKAGLVADAHMRRRTPHGRMAIVWRAL